MVFGPNAPIDLIAIAGPLEGVGALRQIAAQLPPDFPVPVVCLTHSAPGLPRRLHEVLGKRCSIPVKWLNGASPDAGALYLCTAEDPVDNGADGFLTAIAEKHGPRAVAVVLDGAGGKSGAARIHAAGGRVIVQDDFSVLKRANGSGTGASLPFMSLPVDAIAPMLVNLARGDRPLETIYEDAARLFASQRKVAPHVREGLEATLAEAIRATGADLGNIQLLDPADESLFIAVQRGVGIDFLEYFRTVDAAHSSACGRAMRRARPVQIESIEEDPEFAPHLAVAMRSCFSAVQSIPLIGSHGSAIGMISTHYREPRLFSSGDVDAVQYASQMAALLIESRA
ncbi:MAG TPA: chemotaxis protein CheB [Usitatibacter sp.]|nr:chemotaxis protein CheB [Usitatibacter sp.]